MWTIRRIGSVAVLSLTRGHLKDIAKWIDEVDAKYVVMDSFGSLFAGGADLVDANAGYYLYELNRLASEKNVAILLTHHLVKLKDKWRAHRRVSGRPVWEPIHLGGHQ